MTTEPDDDILRAWLLHRLDDANATATFEQRVLADDAFGARLRAIETDLLDDYARQRLDEDDRRAVARWLLATAQDRERLRTAVALAKVVESRRLADAARADTTRPHEHVPRSIPHAAPSRPRQRRAMVFAFAAAAAVLLAVLGYEQRSRSPNPRVELLAANAPTITLLASLQRGAQDAPSAIVSIPHAAPMLRLQVEVADGDASTRYALQIASAQKPVFESHGLAPRTTGPYRFVEVALASTVLVDGDYHVRVTVEGAAEPLQDWTLRTHRN